MERKIVSFAGRAMSSLALLFFLIGSVFAQSGCRSQNRRNCNRLDRGSNCGATVVVLNTQTNARVEIRSNESGFYVVPALKVGTYVVEISAQGFRKIVRSNVILVVNQIAQLDAAMDTGDVAEVIEVTGGAPLIESSSSSLGQVINEKQVINVPINGRNFTQLATLVPGVSRGTPGSNADGSGGNAETFRQGDTGSAAISVNGLREQNNNFLLDGIDNNESIVNTVVFFPPIEALQEFRVITNNAPAEFGRGGGAVINAVTKSGTDGSGRYSNCCAIPSLMPRLPLPHPNRYFNAISLASPLVGRSRKIRPSSLPTTRVCVSVCPKMRAAG